MNCLNPLACHVADCPGLELLVVERLLGDAEVKHLLNKTLGSYSDDYQGNVRRIITGTLDEWGIPRHALSGIELAPRIVTAEHYEQQNRPWCPF